MRVKVMSGMFAGGYNSVYEQAWQDYDDAMDVLNNNDY